MQCYICNLSCSSWTVQNLCDTSWGLYTFQLRSRACEHLWSCCSPLWDVSLHIAQPNRITRISRHVFLQTESYHGRPQQLWEDRYKQHLQCCLNQSHIYLLQMKVLREETAFVSPESHLIVSIIFFFLVHVPKIKQTDQSFLVKIFFFFSFLGVVILDQLITVFVKY